MSKTHHETNPQNDSVDSGSITFKIEGLINRLNRLQKIGDIAIVNTPLNQEKYSEALKEYKEVKYNATHTKQFSSPDDKAAFLSDLNKCQAIIALRAGKDKDVEKYLLNMRTADRLSTDKFILELEPLAAKYAAGMKKNGQIDSNEQPPKSSQLYHYLQKTVRTKVAAHLKKGEYEEAYDETMYLWTHGNNLKVFKLYLSCIEQDKSLKSLQNKADAYIKALNKFKAKISSYQILEGTETISGIYKDLQTALQNISDKIVCNKNTKSTKSADYILKNNCNTSAAEAGNLAEQYAPKQNIQKEETATVPVTEEEQKALKELDTLEKEQVILDMKLVNTKARAEEIRVKTQFNAALQAETARLKAEFEARETQLLAQIKNGQIQQLATLHSQSSSTVKAKDTLVTPNAPLDLSLSVKATQGQGSSVKTEDTTASGSSHSDLPSYDESVSKDTVSKDSVSKKPLYQDVSILKAEIAADAEVAADALKKTLLEKVTNFLASGKTDIMQQIIVDCDNAIKNGTNVYETVNDPKILAVFVSGFLSLNNQEKAEEICGKIAGISPDAYRSISDNKILSLLAKKYAELELYNSCIESCNKLYQASEENYQFLKTIAEKITDTNKQCAIEIFTVVERNIQDQKQRAEICLSKGMIQLFLGNKVEATRELDNAGIYNSIIYKNVPEETLKLMCEKTDSVSARYYYLSKNCTIKLGDQYLAAQFKELGNKIGCAGQPVQKALCEMKAFRCSHENTLLNSLACIGMSTPYYANLLKIPQHDLNQLDNYCQTLIGEIEGPM